MQSLLRDFGVEVEARLWTDSAAALGMCSRRGAGGVKHIVTGTLWIQQAIAQKRLSIHKVKGKVNTADLGTKDVDSATMQRLLEILNVKLVEKLDTSALKAQTGDGG